MRESTAWILSVIWMEGLAHWWWVDNSSSGCRYKKSPLHQKVSGLCIQAARWHVLGPYLNKPAIISMFDSIWAQQISFNYFYTHCLECREKDIKEDKDLVGKYFLSQFIKKVTPLRGVEIHIHVRAHTCIFIQTHTVRIKSCPFVTINNALKGCFV